METKRIALVTGANRGIGFEIARQLARKGYETILTARDEERGRRAAERLRQEGLAHFCQLDVDDPSSIDRAVLWMREKFGRLDVLVNNAAVALDGEASLTEVDPSLLEHTLQTNLLGCLRLCQAVLPQMVERDYGRIVNVTSERGCFFRLRTGAPGGACYRISKTALNALTVLLAEEVKGTNVLVNAANPGWVRTRMGGLKAPLSVVEGSDTAVWLATMPDGGPSGRLYHDRHEFPW